MFAISTGEVLVILALLALLAASYGAQRRHEKTGREPYREPARRAPGDDVWRWYRLANRALIVLPAIALLASFRLPLRMPLVVLAPLWLGALLVAARFPCPRCRRPFGGNRPSCPHCGLKRYRRP